MTAQTLMFKTKCTGSGSTLSLANVVFRATAKNCETSRMEHT